MTKSHVSKVGTLTEASLERKLAVDFARASIGLSGFKVSAEHEARAQRFIDGEVSLEELLNTPASPHK